MTTLSLGKLPRHETLQRPPEAMSFFLLCIMALLFCADNEPQWVGHEGASLSHAEKATCPLAPQLFHYQPMSRSDFTYR